MLSQAILCVYPRVRLLSRFVQVSRMLDAFATLAEHIFPLVHTERGKARDIDTHATQIRTESL